MRRFEDFTIEELTKLRTALMVWQGTYKELFDKNVCPDYLQDCYARLIKESQNLIDEIRAEFVDRGIL